MSNRRAVGGFKGSQKNMKLLKKEKEDEWTDQHSEKLWKLFLDGFISKQTTARDILSNPQEKLNSFRGFSNKTLANHIGNLRRRIAKFEKTSGIYCFLIPNTFNLSLLVLDNDGGGGKISALGQPSLPPGGKFVAATTTDRFDDDEELSYDGSTGYEVGAVHTENDHVLIFPYNPENVLLEPTKLFVQAALPKGAKDVECIITNDGAALKFTYKWLLDSFYSLRYFQEQLKLPNNDAVLVSMDKALLEMKQQSDGKMVFPPTVKWISLSPFTVVNDSATIEITVDQAGDASIYRLSLLISKPRNVESKINIKK